MAKKLSYLVSLILSLLLRDSEHYNTKSSVSIEYYRWFYLTGMTVADQKKKKENFDSQKVAYLLLPDVIPSFTLKRHVLFVLTCKKTLEGTTVSQYKKRAY